MFGLPTILLAEFCLLNKSMLNDVTYNLEGHVLRWQ